MMLSTVKTLPQAVLMLVSVRSQGQSMNIISTMEGVLGLNEQMHQNTCVRHNQEAMVAKDSINL